MIIRCRGDIFDSDAVALVNPVNCVGVMGKGLALEFKKRYPENFEAYARACSSDEVFTGEMYLWSKDDMYIFNFPTKNHWRNPSRLEYIQEGLKDLSRLVRHHHIPSIAIPRLGCGLGGLSWAVIYPLIEAEFAELPEVHVLVYG